MTEQMPLDLAKLWCEYYIFVKKKQDIDFKINFDLAELHDINHTILLFLNHIGEEHEKNELKNSCNNVIETNDDKVINE
ncbi:MAG: hypothetical protein Q8Q69_03235 [Nitrosopumilaceae archaeon]|nr:hypothetical protein [Nitrosopumilaceae archaeon]